MDRLDSVNLVRPHSMLARPVSLLARAFEKRVAIAVVVWLVAGALYLTLPPSPDQFNHAYLGWRLVQGDAPYRDFIDMNWPGVIGLHALAVGAFGVNLWSWRALDFLLFAISASLLADIVRLAAGRSAGWLTLVLAPLVYASIGFWVAGQQDTSAAQFLVGALWLHVRGHEQKSWQRWQLGVGALVACAMLNKPTVAVIALIFPLQLLWLGTPLRTVLTRVAIAGLATLLTLAGAFAATVACGPSVSEVVDAVFTFNFVAQSSGTLPLAESLVRLSVPGRSLPWVGATVASLLVVPWLLCRRNRSIATTALPLLWLCGVLSYLAQGRGAVYHLAPSMFALIGGQATLLALLASGRISFGTSAWKRPVAAGLVAMVALGLAYRLAAVYHSLPLALAAGDYDRHLMRFVAGDGIRATDATAFARRLASEPLSGCLLVAGEVSAINYLSQHRQPTRFYYLPVIIVAHPPLPMADRWMALWEQDLHSADCRYALVAQRQMEPAWSTGSSRGAAALRGLLEHYDESGMLGPHDDLAVYKRK